jgi:hypothetical protein
MQNTVKWNALADAVGSDDARLNQALGSAAQAFQDRHGFLPDGFDDESWNDLCGMALKAYKAL